MKKNEFVYENIDYLYFTFDSIVLEKFFIQKKNTEEKMFKHDFISYLIIKYKDPNIRKEIKNAKTDEERNKITKKYKKDFEEWNKRKQFEKMVTHVGIAAPKTSVILLQLLLWNDFNKEMYNTVKNNLHSSKKKNKL